MKTVILCGGSGIRLQSFLEYIPKAMVKIDHRPMIWHVMKSFARYGHNDFVLALGAGGEMIRDYFLNYDLFNNDISISLEFNQVKKISQHQERAWNITLVDTGEAAGTGARLARCRKYLEGERFFLTYSDCLANIAIDKLLSQHEKNGQIATVSGVNPPYRYGEFIMDGDRVDAWHEVSKLSSKNGWVNGGFMVFESSIFNYINPLSECTIEKEVFGNLVKNRQLGVYKHDGFWQCLDNEREYQLLKNLCKNNLEYWLFD